MSKTDTDAAYVFISMYHFPDLIYLPIEKEQRVRLYPPQQPNNIRGHRLISSYQGRLL